MDMSVLRGHSSERAQLYGLPHIGATYTGSGGYARTTQACKKCDRARSAHTHHIAPRSEGRVYALSTPNGTWMLRSPLIALCPACHMGVHNGFWRIRWVWDCDPELWWSGELLMEFGPHSTMLYEYGHYVFEERDGKAIEYRGRRYR